MPSRAAIPFPALPLYPKNLSIGQVLGSVLAPQQSKATYGARLGAAFPGSGRGWGRTEPREESHAAICGRD